MVDVQDLLQKAGKFCSRFPKVKSWDIIGGVLQNSSIIIEKGYLKTAESSTNHAINIRLYGEKGKTGSVSITKMDLPFIQDSISRAVSLMKGSLPNLDFKCLAKPAKMYPKITTPYDPTIKELTIDDSVDLVDSFMNITSLDERIVSVSGDISMYDMEVSILNSNGVDLHNKHSSVSLSTEITMIDTIKGTKEFSNGYEGQEYTHFYHVSPEPILESALEKAKNGLLKSKIPMGSYPIVLSPEAGELLFLRTIANAINGQAIYEKRSFMRNQLDKKVASENLKIIDDPWLDGGIHTSAWDGEGTPTRPLNIIEKGVLQSYLHNVYSANLFETESTGHGSRSLHSSSVGISPSNLKIGPGKVDFDTMITDIKKGVLLEASYDRPNFVTGEFSGLISSGFLIEDGEIKNALRESTMGFNIFDFFHNITQIGKKIYRRGSNYLPYIKVKDVRISAKE